MSRIALLDADGSVTLQLVKDVLVKGNIFPSDIDKLVVIFGGVIHLEWDLINTNRRENDIWNNVHLRHWLIFITTLSQDEPKLL